AGSTVFHHGPFSLYGDFSTPVHTSLPCATRRGVKRPRRDLGSWSPTLRRTAADRPRLLSRARESGGFRHGTGAVSQLLDLPIGRLRVAWKYLPAVDLCDYLVARDGKRIFRG